ncbi:AsmA-like C-terminal region-containing protein [Sediminicola luteus]|uniref:AsmA-like C-terminal region-containing protein n=1 Tax=Sediminicola luteus TaxID=319238 RepID=A0ABV2U0I2_9FLAO
MKKKIAKITGLVLVVLIGVLIAAPFFLKGKITKLIKEKVNTSINATFDFADADLSLFSSFPNATVTLEDISLVNKTPFEGDTLFASKEVQLKMSVMELFKDAAEPIELTYLKIDGAQLNIKYDMAENANYDIAVDKGDTKEAEDNFLLTLQKYEILNSNVIYHDLASNMRLEISEMNHSGTGDLSLDKSELDTQTTALVSFEMDSTNYLNKNPVQLKALIGVDLKELKYTFLKNEALVNQLALVFDGYVKMNEDNQEVNISFKTPSSDFKNFLAVIPETYSKNIENVKTTGNFTVEGAFTGIVDDLHIPQFKIDIKSDNASFKYPDLPKSVNNVHIDTEITNTTGITEDTFVDIRKLSFMIDQDKFNMVANIKDLMGNTKVNAHIDGKMNLANISKAYPVPSDLDLKGILTADISTAFDMATVEKKQYENTKTSGKLTLQGFEYKSAEIPNPVKLENTSVTFNPKTVTLNELKGTTGKTDFDVTGTINNLLGFMFNDEKVEGNFNLKSNTFALNDFMVAETTGEGTDKASKTPPVAEEKIKIPSFLDCTINATATNVLYDNLTLKNVSGTLKIKDEKAELLNMTSSIFDGKMAFNGEVSTKNDTPTFAMKLGMESFKIGETFKSLELFKVLAPIANILQGTLNSDIALSGNLKDDFTPNLVSLSGNILASLFTEKIDTDKSKLLSSLDGALNFIDFDKLDLKELKTALTFEDGLVKVKPFTIKYQDIAINVAGSHTFDQKLNYTATFEVPAKYLGKDISNLIAKIDDKSLEGLTIPVTANIGGLYSSPTVSTDLTSGVKNLTAKLVEIEKQKLLNQGKDKAKNLIGGLLGGDAKTKDSTAQKTTGQEGVKEVLGGLLGGKPKTQDTTAAKTGTMPPKKDAIKEAASGVLGGFLNKKKKDAEVKKDSVN